MIKKLKLLTIAAALVLVVASPADAREFASFNLSVDQGNSSNWGEDTASTQIKKKMTQVEVPQGMSLDISFFRDIDGGTTCFPLPAEYTGWFVVRQDRSPPLGHAEFYFTANGKNDSPGHKYVLLLNGFFVPEENFPPAEKEDITIMFAMDWEMITEGRGQDRKNTCRGEGSFGNSMVTVTVERTN